MSLKNRYSKIIDLHSFILLYKKKKGMWKSTFCHHALICIADTSPFGGNTTGGDIRKNILEYSHENLMPIGFKPTVDTVWNHLEFSGYYVSEYYVLSETFINKSDLYICIALR